MPTTSPAAPTVTIIRLFGTFEARRGDAPLPALRTRKEKYLLFLLLLRHGQRLERDWLAGVLWPDSRESQALYNLSRSLSNLRQVFGAGLELTSPTTRSICLQSNGLDVDVHRFDALIARRNPTLLDQAAALYRGPLLEDCLEEWVLPERQVRAQAMRDALQTLAARALAARQADAAIAYLRRGIALFPLEEPAYRLLMQALAANGEYAAAMQVFRDLRRLLREELRAEPDAATQAALRELRAVARDPAARHALPAAANASAPASPLYGASPLAPAFASAIPPLPPDAPLYHVPQPLTTLIGRRWELAETLACLERARLVTLTGAGGVGKTRLALHVASERRGCHPHGIWFIDLAPLTDGALVPQAIADALGVPEKQGQTRLQTLRAHLAAQDALLILDNCEHLAAACAATVGELLTACPYLRLLATSRQALGLPGEADWRVPSLALPPVSSLPPGHAPRANSPVQQRDAPAGVEDRAPRRESDSPIIASLLEYEAVQLFVERARQARRTFTPTGANIHAIAEICRRLDGIPLALELAAARVRVLPAEQISVLLNDRFRLLTGSAGGGLPRHQTLRALIDWSHDLLTSSEQALLRRLSVFVGDWPLAAVQDVCGDATPSAAGSSGISFDGSPAASLAALPAGSPDIAPDVSSAVPCAIFADASPDTFPGAAFDLLAGLVDKSLVMIEERPGAARYRLLETVRAYAGERLRESGEETAVRERHAAWFTRLAARAEAHLAGPEQIEWLDQLETEHDNLRAALDWWLRASGRVPDALRLTGHLRRFWLTRGYLSEGRVRTDAALAHPAGQSPTPERASALDTTASLAFYQADYPSAQAGWEQALKIQRRNHDTQGVAASLSNLGRVAQDQGEYERARGLYEQSLALKRELGDKQGLAVTLNNLCRIAIYQTEFEQARALGEQSLTLYRQAGNLQGIADTLHSLGQVAFHQGEWNEAGTLHAQGLALRQEMGDRRGEAAALNSLGIIAQAAGEYDRARELWERSLAIKRELGDRQGIGNTLQNLGNIAYFRADYALAHTLYEQSLAIRQELGSRRGVAALLHNMGQVALDRGDPERALALYRRSLQGHWELRDRSGVLGLLTGFAEVAQTQGQPSRAARLYGAHDALRVLLGTPLPPSEQAAYQSALAQTQADLAPDAFSAAYAEGQAMTLEQVVACALSTNAPCALDDVAPRSASPEQDR